MQPEASPGKPWPGPGPARYAAVAAVFVVAALVIARLWLAGDLHVRPGDTRAAASARPSPTPVPSVSPSVAPPPAGPPTLKEIWAGFQQSTSLAFAPSDPRIFVLEKAGVVKVGTAKDGVPGGAPQVYLDLTKEVSKEGESGLLGMAFHPKFKDNGRLYLDFNDKKGDARIVEFTVDPRAVPAQVKARRDVFFADDFHPNHNGGCLQFGPDGRLYATLGDGGLPNDPRGMAQKDGVLFGKLFRIDVDKPDAPPEVLAKGLRNPWRFSFDRKTGDIWIGDVGQYQVEEVDVIRAGTPPVLNFGWPALEGTRANKGTAPKGAVAPVLTFGHGKKGAAVIGGVVYRGPGFPELQGRYFYASFQTGDIWTVDAAAPGEPALVSPSLGGPKPLLTSFGQDSEGAMYVSTLDRVFVLVSA